MSSGGSSDGPLPLVYKFECECGTRYVVYNAAALWNPQDHVPDKWYVLPYSAPFPTGQGVGEAYDTAEEAERAARSWHEPTAPRAARTSEPSNL